MLDERDLFHVGIVVDDLEAAMAAVGGVAGLHWGPERSATMETETPDGALSVTSLRYVFSEGTRTMELVEAAGGTLWEPVPHGVHHVGYWSDALVDDSDRLHGSGATLVLRGRRAGTASWMFAYHRTSSGLVELVDASRKAALTAMAPGEA